MGVKGTCAVKMNQLQFLGIICAVMLIIVYRTTNYQFLQAEKDEKLDPFSPSKGIGVSSNYLDSLPHGIIQARTDLELKSLWSIRNSRSKVNVSISHNLLAIPVGIEQKRNVDAIAQKFLSENFTIMLFHYDAIVDGWLDLPWSKNVIHIVAQNQTKWWFAKRFLHPAVVCIYDYIFLWDEDLGVKNFNPGRYMKIVKSEGLEISQPALDPNSTGIHHRITIRKRTYKFHRRVSDIRGSTKCSEDSEGPPCTGFHPTRLPPSRDSLAGFIERLPLETPQLIGAKSQSRTTIQDCINISPIYPGQAGSRASSIETGTKLFVEGMAPVFSRSAWHCAWHLIQNDLVHGWGMDMKLGYCAQGDRTKNVGVVDSEYVVHQGKQTLGGASTKKPSNPGKSIKKPTVDVRVEIRRQSTLELKKFKERWEQAVKEDKNWVDPFPRKSTLEHPNFIERWEQAVEEDKNWVDHPFQRKWKSKRRSQRLHI